MLMAEAHGQQARERSTDAHGLSPSSWLVAPVDPCHWLLMHTTGSKRDGEKRFASTYCTPKPLHRSCTCTNTWRVNGGPDACVVRFNISPYVFKRFLFHITICLTKSRWNDKNISLCFAFCEIMLLILPMLVLFNVLRDSEQKKGGMSGKSKFFCLLCCLGMKTVNGMDQIIYSWLSVHYFTHNRKVRHDSSS